ncbi:hypothetical protein ACFQS4_10095 [Saliphagus sp. GCM10025317]
MSNTGKGDTRTIALCTTCGSMYAAREKPDGTVLPIGRNGCSCENAAFKKIALELEADETGPDKIPD